jgi:hypothetical protein
LLLQLAEFVKKREKITRSLLFCNTFCNKLEIAFKLSFSICET